MNSNQSISVSDINLSEFYVTLLNEIVNSQTVDGRRFSARLVAIDGSVLIFQNSRGAIFRHRAQDLVYVSPREGSE
jgi:hypothetical protein